MKVCWSKVDDPYEWRTEGGSVWVGHTVIAVWIVKSLQRLERLRSALKRWVMKYAKPKQPKPAPATPAELREQRRQDFKRRMDAENRGRKR